MGSAPSLTRCLAASSAISPAPTRSTDFPARLPKIFRPSSTAANDTDTAWRPTSVSVRTFLATAMAWDISMWMSDPTVPDDWASANASLTCPRIWGSPSTMESRLAATRKTWRTASSSVLV